VASDLLFVPLKVSRVDFTFLLKFLKFFLFILIFEFFIALYFTGFGLVVEVVMNLDYFC